jgi:hypothetical protein
VRGRARQVPAALPPRPDHGIVEVEPWTEPAAFWHASWEDEAGPYWRASWRDGDRLLQSPPCSREEAVTWADSVPAAWRVVRDAPTADWTTLPPR